MTWPSCCICPAASPLLECSRTCEYDEIVTLLYCNLWNHWLEEREIIIGGSDLIRWTKNGGSKLLRELTWGDFPLLALQLRGNMAGNSRWPLDAENDSWPTSSYKTRTQSHKLKNLDSANHMDELGSEFFPKPSKSSASWLLECATLDREPSWAKIQTYRAVR